MTIDARNTAIDLAGLKALVVTQRFTFVHHTHPTCQATIRYEVTTVPELLIQGVTTTSTLSVGTFLILKRLVPITAEAI